MKKEALIALLQELPDGADVAFHRTDDCGCWWIADDEAEVTPTQVVECFSGGLQEAREDGSGFYVQGTERLVYVLN